MSVLYLVWFLLLVLVYIFFARSSLESPQDCRRSHEHVDVTPAQPTATLRVGITALSIPRGDDINCSFHTRNAAPSRYYNTTQEVAIALDENHPTFLIISAGDCSPHGLYLDTTRARGLYIHYFEKWRTGPILEPDYSLVPVRHSRLAVRPLCSYLMYPYLHLYTALSLPWRSLELTCLFAELRWASTQPAMSRQPWGSPWTFFIGIPLLCWCPTNLRRLPSSSAV